MSIQIIKRQCSFMLKRKGAGVAFYALFVIVLMNFITNVFEFQGLDRLEMYHPVKLLLLSYNRTYDNADFALLLIQLYPILVVCPSGSILLSEKQRREDTLIISRIGIKNYYLNIFISTFFVTAFIFTVPFLVELLLNCISFPLSATGDFLGLSIYDPNYNEIRMRQSYLAPWLYSVNEYLYAVVGIIFFGFFSGVIGMTAVAISSFFKAKYKILSFIPTYVIVYTSFYLSEIVKLPISVCWWLRLYNGVN